MLYIVSTPIGNLEDITLRALRILKEADYVICEDTRRTQILLNKYEIKKPLIIYHSHSKENKEQKISTIMKENEKVVLVSDAGTPGISDPGYRIIQLALENDIQVSPIPGPAAFLTALQASGAPINQFVYIGFLPLKKGRQTLLKSFQTEKRTIVLYESPHRLIKTLSQLSEFLGEYRKVVVARELTKIHEEFVRGTLSEVTQHFEEKGVKGEFVVIVEGVRD